MKHKPFSMQVNLDDFIPATDEEKAYMVQMRPSTTFFKDGVKRLVKNKVALVSFIVIVVITLSAILIPIFWPYGYEQMLGVTPGKPVDASYNNLPPMHYSTAEQAKIDAGEKVFPHLFGTDSSGRDYFIRVVYGTRISLAVGFFASIIVLIIGLTIVAMGTSAPELAVSTSAALSGSNEIALSNVIGSNMFNLLVVLGFCALFSPVPVSSEIIKRDFPISILMTILVLLFSGGLMAGKAAGSTVGMISRPEGLILLIVFMVYMFLLVRNAMRSQTEEETVQETVSLKKCILLMIVGIALIAAGGQAVVDSAKSIAYFFGMSETLVGLTIVAVGTSLPELVTSIVASRKHENGLAVGNVVGSNMFNIMFILGTTAVLNPLPVTFELSVNLLFLLLISAVTFVFVTTGKQLNRAEGAIMCMMYVGQAAFAIMG